MTNFLKNHPFGVQAHFNESIVLTFAVKKEDVEKMIPNHLELDIFDDKWAFLALAMVDTKDLRPKGFPKLVGKDFFLIGYRIFVRYTNKNGKRLRGLYILKSQTNKSLMTFFGNIFTHYNYTTTDISMKQVKNHTCINSINSGLEVCFTKDGESIKLPVSSPFSNWKEARRFAGPLPFTFTIDEINNEVLIIEGVRQHWKPKPIKVIDYNIDFINKLNFDIQLSNAFIIENIPYYWKKGKLEKW